MRKIFNLNRVQNDYVTPLKDTLDQLKVAIERSNKISYIEGLRKEMKILGDVNGVIN